jgi:hypothetical protein
MSICIKEYFKEWGRVALWMLAGVVYMFAILPPAHADVVGVHVGSYHTSKQDSTAGKPWNNVNPGIYYMWDNEGLSSFLPDGRYVIGTYFNSIRKQSAYVGYVYPVTDYLDVVVGVVSGYSGEAANGRRYSGYPVMPLIVPSFHFPLYDGVEARVHVIPKVAKGGAAAVHFSVEMRF